MSDQNDQKNLLYLRLEFSEISKKNHVEICAIQNMGCNVDCKNFICAARKALCSFFSPKHDCTGNNNSLSGF